MKQKTVNHCLYFPSAVAVYALMLMICSCNKNEPEACFNASPTTALVLDTILFQNCSEQEDSIIWKFGDGYLSHENNPIHAYSYAGNYLVELFAIQSGKTVNHTSQVISISGIAPFTVFGGYAGTQTHLASGNERTLRMILKSCECSDKMKFKISSSTGGGTAIGYFSSDSFSFTSSPFYGSGYFSEDLDTLRMFYKRDISSSAPPQAYTFIGVREQ